MKKTILITGGAGFIGYNFIKICLKKNYQVVNIDPLKYSANKFEINKFKNNKNYYFYKININNKKYVEKILLKHKILQVVNFAAESHVDRSINKPKFFFKNNCMDFINFLITIKEHYSKLNLKKKNIFKFIHVSTDEVYGSLLNKEKPFTEKSNLKPNNPYSSSKAASELILRSFSNTYDFPYIITNCSNNYGKYQNDEKLIPTIFRNALKNRKIPIYGNGKNIRDWIYVDDHCFAILKVLDKGKDFERYNIGGNCEIKNINLAKIICSILNEKVPQKKNYINLINYVKDRPGHDLRYAINSNKIQKLNWKPKTKLIDGLNKIADHYIKKYF